MYSALSYDYSQPSQGVRSLHTQTLAVGREGLEAKSPATVNLVGSCTGIP